MAEKYISNFDKGLYSRLENESIPDGAASDSNNWVTLGDHIELRRGRTLMGTENTAVGKISDVFVADRFDGQQVAFHCVDRKIKYYNTVMQDWVETTTPDILPAVASGEDFCFDQYHSLAGAFLYGSSKNSGVYKIPIANPASVIDLKQTSFRGKLRIKQNRTFLWNRQDANGGFDTTGIYGSYIDKDELSDYTAHFGFQDATGDGSTKVFTQILQTKPNSPLETAHYVRVAGGVQAGTAISAIPNAINPQITSVAHGLTTGDNVIIYGVVGMTQLNNIIFTVTVFTPDVFGINVDSTAYTPYVSGGTVMKSEILNDDRNGNLLGRYGGTGSIDYATETYATNFNTPPPAGTPIVSDYYTEISTTQGIFDFSKDLPRDPGQGFTFRQDDGGADFQNIFTLGGDEYCMHTRKTWKLTLTSDDTDATNLIYRNNVGIPYWRAGAETGEGIYYADAPDSSEPYIRLLAPNALNTEVIPQSISDQISLIDYRFDFCVIKEWGDYIVVACRTKDSPVNDTLFTYNRLYKLWDKHDYRVSCMAILNGMLIAGDSASKNVYTLFSGLTDEENTIPNQWTSGKDLIGMENNKYCNIFKISGLIQSDQQFDIYYSYDNADFIKAATINGSGPYVDQGQKINVGANTVGSTEVGGSSSGLQASPYQVEFPVNTPRFHQIRVRFVATKVGYVSVSEYAWKDVRDKGKYLPPQYVLNAAPQSA